MIRLAVLVLPALPCLPVLLNAAPPDWKKHPEGQWVKQSPREGAPVPDFGWEGSAVLDPQRRQWIHHAGHDGIPQGFHLFTYQLDSGRWEQRFPNTSPPGACCVDGANTFDLLHQRLVRFPGAALGHGYQWSRGVKLKSSAVWLYDPAANEWTNMRPAPYHLPLNARDWLGSLNGGATYDATRGLALSFGGQGTSGGTNNLFVYDAHANLLQRLPAANAPEPRDGMGLTYDTKNDCLVLFGSQYSNDEKTWIYRYTTGKWEGHTLDPHPPGKKLGTYATIPRLAYDSLNGICLCVVWDTRTNEHQTWVLDVEKLRWTRVNPPVDPSPSMSRSRNLSYWADENLFLLELSPRETKGKGVELWSFRYKQPKVLPAASPGAPVVLTERDAVRLTWRASPAATKGYHIYRAQTAHPWQANFHRLGSTNDTTYTDRGVEAGKVYLYRVTAITAENRESPPSPPGRTQPRVPATPVVSVLGKDQIEITWRPSTDKEVVGYNIYRGVVTVRTVTRGTPGAWKDNDPAYAEPLPVEVRDITGWEKLNEKVLKEPRFDDKVDLTKPGPEAKDYRLAVHAYVVRAVNRLETESGPSPYALTIPSAPTEVFCREQGKTAELKWRGNPEKGIAGYHVYKLQGTWKIVRLTDKPIRATTFRQDAGSDSTRYWIVAVDPLGQEGEPSAPVWFNHRYRGFFTGEWHQ